MATTITQRVVLNARRRGVTVLTHSQWGSLRIPVYASRRLFRRHSLLPNKPVDTVWQHISVTVPSGDFKRDVRTVESIGFSRFGTGSSYNILIDMKTGEAAVGMPLDARGAHTLNDKKIPGYSFDQNAVSIAFVVIGMPGTPLSAKAQETITNILAACIDEGVVTKTFDYNPHSMAAFKDCPCDATRSKMPAIRAAAIAAVTKPEPKPAPKPDPKPTGPTRTRRGGSWNLRVGRNPDVVAREVQAFLDAHDLDFLTICEAADYIDALTDSLKGYKVYAKFDGDGPARDSAVIVRKGRKVTDLRVHRLERIGWERKPGRIGLHWPRSGVSVDDEGLRVMSVHMPPGPFQGPRFWRRGVAFDTSAHKLRRIGLRWSDRPWVMAGDWNVGKRVAGSERDPSAGWIASETGARIKGDGIDYVMFHGCRVSEYARHDFGTSDHRPITFVASTKEN